MKDLIILGAGGTSFDLVDIAVAMNKVEKQWNICGFLDDNPELIGKNVYGFPVLGAISQSANYENAYFISSIADAYNTKLRKSARDKVPFGNERFASLIDPRAIISDTAVVESGAVIYANVTISGTVHIGHNSFICGNSFFGHECSIGDHCAFSAGNLLASDVKVGESCYFGIGSIVRHRIEIGDNCLIGMGTKVVKNVPNNTRLINRLDNIFTPN